MARAFPVPFANLIRINVRCSCLRIMGSVLAEAAMSFDTMLVIAAVLSVFAVFAAVLILGDFQTRPAQRKGHTISHRRRKFLSRPAGAADQAVDARRLER